MKKFIYLEPESEAPLMIRAKKKPSEKNTPERGTWILREFTADGWCLPSFPEITWGRLKKLKFVGEVKP